MNKFINNLRNNKKSTFQENKEDQIKKKSFDNSEEDSSYSTKECTFYFSIIY